MGVATAALLAYVVLRLLLASEQRSPHQITSLAGYLFHLL